MDTPAATAYLPSSKLISVMVAVTSDGGAHPSTTRYGVLLRGNGTLITSLRDVFDGGIHFAEHCMHRALEQMASGNVEPFPGVERSLALLATDLRNWLFREDGATLLIDPYAVAAYVYGPQDVEFTYEELAPFFTAEFQRLKAAQ